MNKNENSLKILINMAKKYEYAICICNLLPIKSKINKLLVYLLYQEILKYEFCYEKVSQQIEFYSVCKDLLMSEYQQNICSLIRVIPIHQEIIESSGLHSRIVELILETNSYDSLWNLMSMIFTFCDKGKFTTFRLLCPKFSELLSSSNEKIRLSSFLCLSTVIDKNSFGINYVLFLKSSVEFANSPMNSIQSKSIYVFDNFFNHIKSNNNINDVLEHFLNNFKSKNPATIHIAKTFLYYQTSYKYTEDQLQKILFISK